MSSPMLSTIRPENFATRQVVSATTDSVDAMDRSHVNSHTDSRDDSQAFHSQYRSLPAMAQQMYYPGLKDDLYATPHDPGATYDGGAPLNMGHMTSSLPAHQHAQAYHSHGNYPQHPQQYGGQYGPEAHYQMQQYGSRAYTHPQQMQHMAYYGGQVMGPPVYETGSHDVSAQPGQHTQYSQNGQLHHQHVTGPSSQLPSKGHKGSFDLISATFPPRQQQGYTHYPHYPFDPSTAAATGHTSLTMDTSNLMPRGPPRKPRQSGHALWVGNLPPNATVVDLKDHFSRGATKDILSLKLMSQSNCAFVNYKTQESCTAAMQRFHDSRFHATRLVFRLRKTSMSEPSPATSPISGSGAFFPRVDGNRSISKSDEIVEHAISPTPLSKTVSSLPSADQYFVLKSLTFEDLLVSTRTGVWTTQVHNEESLNAAFESAQNVYLVFSVNKSGEYFGYARMSSRIEARPIEQEPEKSEPSNQVDGVDGDPGSPSVANSFTSGGGDNHALAPKTIPTAATEHAPRGSIIDDLARGTIFWEADGDDDVLNLNADNAHAGTDLDAQPEISNGANKGSSRSFEIQWMVTRKLPFYKTRGMRNPLNGDREVKIARDGTQIAPDVGARLLELFGGPHGKRMAMSSAELN